MILKPYEGWCPYCLVCPTMSRMRETEYGYQCVACQNKIDFDLLHYEGPVGKKTPEELAYYDEKIKELQDDPYMAGDEKQKRIAHWEHQKRYARPKADHDKFCFHVPKPITADWLEGQYAAGRLFRVSALVTGAFYEGSCRNASVARWDGILKSFTYVRHKFGSAFTEEINTVEDDNGFDLFLPHYEIVDPTDQRVQELKKLLGERV